jgi:hypothetical protein
MIDIRQSTANRLRSALRMRGRTAAAISVGHYPFALLLAQAGMIG